MAGAMRRMGVYLGLVEDDDARTGYDRYDARQTDLEQDDRRYDRYPRDDRYEDGYDPEGDYPATDYGYEYTDAPYAPESALPSEVHDPAPQPEVSLGRRPAVRSLGLAGSAGTSTGSTAVRHGGGLSSVGAAPAASGRSGVSAGGSGSAGAGLPAGSVRSGLVTGGSGSAALARSEPVAVAPEPPPAPTPAPAPAQKPYRITTVHPASYNEARTIGERFREGMPVIMNLTEMEHADAKRLVDFAIGLTFGLHGSIERVTAKVFLLSPQDVDVTAEDKARIREGGFFNQP
ncbi:cell division protein SepF [Modestobacter sp. I12A-02662]|uniref:cell division protein SepF n=1 Tax=Modestobacter sp. I12A-02662 TaxID=1730496 RepID=UPI0034DE9800